MNVGADFSLDSSTDRISRTRRTTSCPWRRNIQLQTILIIHERPAEEANLDSIECHDSIRPKYFYFDSKFMSHVLLSSSYFLIVSFFI